MKLLFIDFGNTGTTNRLVKRLKKTHKEAKIVVDVYSIFDNKKVETIDQNDYDALILGGSKNNISVNNLLSNYPSNSKNNPLYEAYDIINMFDSKPILGIGYGCQVMCSKHGCILKELCVPNTNKSQDVIFDRRYGIHANLRNRELTCAFNNRYGVYELGKDTNIIARHSQCQCYNNTTRGKKSGIGFKFKNKEHYGYLFRLADNEEVGDKLLSKFISLLPRS